ncbi:hypothetical protein [Streptomyces hokutonensis]|uniref:hypothetical protein n=1 Tax=Streptomyces hokutonensis TaxID=1306990 RepID=UPI00131A0D33|nr:hypothetical protein [Streptomyces hokutonensis]
MTRASGQRPAEMGPWRFVVWFGTVSLLADFVRRATAYGLFAGVVGAASLAGGALTGGLYGYSIPVLITVVVAVQVLALVLLAVTPATRR